LLIAVLTRLADAPLLAQRGQLEKLSGRRQP
jgi:hypothetical protein